MIEEAYRLIRTHPECSIGIATMNAKQTELIQTEFDRLVLEAPEIQKYISEFAGGVEEFFIKNLENVQGDERDIILISTVYGPSKEGTVRQNFGPMNREVGWRRLNVLVTRAKMSTRIFTSLRPSDIKITEKSSRGLIALQAYLTYAAGGAAVDDREGGEPDSEFEVFVADALRAAGYDVVPQIGVENFRIDLGVKHPDYPIGFIAGIECDGARYHSGFTVRDRDRIRQSILENMGWNIHRIWSTDWFQDPARETARLLARLDDWRQEKADIYARLPVIPQPEMASAASNDDAPPPEAAAANALASSPAEARDDIASEPREPTGRLKRPLDDIEWRDVIRGRLYHIWPDGRFAGEVEVLSRSTGAARVYGGSLAVSLSEYQGTIAPTGDRILMKDVYAAVREVARRARLAWKEEDSEAS